MMSDNTWENKLAEMDNAFEQAEVKPASKFAEASVLPEGRYNCEISMASMFESKDGRTFFKITFRPIEGECKDMFAEKIYSLDNPERMAFLKQDLVALGHGIQKLSQLPSIVDALRGVQQKVQVKKKGEYTNYYFNGKPAPVPSADVKTEVPF